MAKTRAGWWVGVMAIGCAVASVAAQDRAVFQLATPGWRAESVGPGENVPPITGAPFTADATTEFTQTLSDGNRIEQRFSTSIARDGHGRTRREQEMAFVGPLSVLHVTTTNGRRDEPTAGRGRGGAFVWTDAPAGNGPQRYVVITDPVGHASYTLDDQRKEARQSPGFLLEKLDDVKRQVELKRGDARTASANAPVVEQLGTRQIEGVSATGTRTTNTIPAGQIGNLAPINLVSERWFSTELGMAVLITRSDPRSGDTVYRLTNIVRAEPPPDLFTVPSDYTIVGPADQKELKKVIERARTGGPK